MTIDRQKQLLQEICSEFDLETVIEALVEAHGLADVADQLEAIDQDLQAAESDTEAE